MTRVYPQLVYDDDESDGDGQVEVQNTPAEAEASAAVQRHEYYVREIEDVGGIVTISPILR